MDRTEQYRKIVLLWVKPELIQQCLVDVNHCWGNGMFSYVRCADYLKEDRLFAVQVQMTAPYPFIEDEWKKKWNHDWVSQCTRNVYQQPKMGYGHTGPCPEGCGCDVAKATQDDKEPSK